MYLLLDIINTEYGIGEKILNNNSLKQTVIISSVCKMFNVIVKEKMEKYYNIYIKNIIIKKIDVIITNKMYSIIKKNGNKISLYKTPEEYNTELNELFKNINNKFIKDIIKDLKILHEEYIFDASISNSCYEIYIFGIMENEYLKLIKFLENLIK
jgi:hypothetical protein